MRLIRCRENGKDRLGRLDGDEVTLLQATGDCLSSLIASRAMVSAGPSRSLGGLELLAPIRLGRFFCIGLNYSAHVAETARDPSERPSVFLRSADSFAAPGAALWRPHASTHFDYEGELGCVIGRAGRQISECDALDHVFGYTCVMEGSVRDFQKHSVGAGKNFERSGAIGPWIVTKDEAPAWDAMRLRTRLNGEVVQEAGTDTMIWGVPEIIAYLSQITTLLPGDVISTGTPAGVGARRTPPLWMKAGDRVEVDIDGVGTLFNGVVDEPAPAAIAVPA
ncbi:fumarylacetoacetate hydrolase family protein [Phenylobacterium sp. VNQ135]|uniref:fumarylacetoacetate hydrolase family protein n=1 Tax=Phenylobacterium sp. VNQ135 TaxID=3400922 RepID=UPI003C026320